MEEDKKKPILKKQRTRKLNCPFAVNLLQENFNSPAINTAAPFSWDRIPANAGNIYQTPPTPPPSSRWQPSAIEERLRAHEDIHIADELRNPFVDGFGGNEAIDLFSLAETTEGFVENCKTCSTEEPDDANQCPDFMMQRFLPDAQALAAASLAQKKLLFSPSPRPNASFSRSVGVSDVGCGFRNLYHSLVKSKDRTVPGASKSGSTLHSTNKQKKFEF